MEVVRDGSHAPHRWRKPETSLDWASLVFTVLTLGIAIPGLLFSLTTIVKRGEAGWWTDGLSVFVSNFGWFFLSVAACIIINSVRHRRQSRTR